MFPWLQALYPIWSRLTPETFRPAVRIALVELLLSGCSTAADHHYLYPNGLENAVDMAQQQVAAPMPYPYPPMPPPPLVQYVVNNVAPPVTYQISGPAPSQAAGCDPSWTDCSGPGWASGFYPTFYPAVYPASLVVLRPPFIPRPRPTQGVPHFATQQPAYAPFGGLRRG